MKARSLDLLQEAEEHASSARQLARDLGLNANAINLAKNRGHLSPGLAATLAMYLGQDETQAARWCLLAVAESERSAKLRPKLRKIVEGLKS
jgi:plasmid maintenance system antidote protein VapI